MHMSLGTKHEQSELIVLWLIVLRILNIHFFSILKMLCKKRTEKNLNFSLAFAMGIVLRESTPSTLGYDGYLKIFYLLKLFGLF